MNPSYLFYSLGLVSALTIVVLSFIIIVKSEKIRQLSSSVRRLQSSLEQMDEQEVDQIPVLEEDKVVGIIARDRLRSLVKTRSELKL